MINEAIDFKYLLIENYKKLKISEKELAVIFVVDHMISLGEPFVTGDLLALKMNYDASDIDVILSNLLKKGLIEFVTKGKKTVTTLNPLKEKLYRELEITHDKEKELIKSKQLKEQLEHIYSSYEKLLGRSLSPVEISKIKEWVNFGYTEEMIVDALKDAINKGSKSFRTIDQILLKYQIREDMESDGMTSIDSDWQHNLEETIKIAKTPWLDDPDDK